MQVRALIVLALIVALVPACDAADDRRDASRPSSPSVSGSASVTPATSVLAELRGHRLAFMVGPVLFTARADGSERRSIARVPGAYAAPSWSADADAFVIRTERRGKDGRIEGIVVRVGADGSTVDLSRRTGSIADAMVAWAPGGRRIAFISTREGDTLPQLYSMDVEGREVRRVRRTPFEAQYPAWSPDGERIAFTGVTGGSDFDLYVVDADGTDLRRLTSSPSPENWPTWAPDSERLAYSIEDEIWLIEDDGSNARRLTPSEVSAGEPNWSPDGAWIAFDCSTAEPVICAIQPDGTDFVTLFGGAAFPVWIG
jgi:dipeptidyl aminopeptidase/acylaminoacyl peptidase